VGRYAGGQQAVASHTGALAGTESAFNAGFRRAGVIRAETTEELFDWARALAWCPLPAGRQVAVLTNAGGPGVTAADALEANNLRLAILSQETRTALQELLPPAASLHNPVDMLAAASPQQYANCLKILLADPGVHSVMVILPPPPMHTAGGIAKAIIPVIYTADKPVVIALMGERLIQEAVEHFRAAHVPDYRFPERAAKALAVLVQRAEYLATGEQVPPDGAALTGIQPEKARAILGQSASSGWLPQEKAFALLKAYGIRTNQPHLAKTGAEAARLAEQLGYPVALKIASLDIPHKSDVGGASLNLESAVAVQTGFDDVLENCKATYPDIVIEGVYVQRMASEGQEVILGAIQDPQFGALVMFGSGGVEVEGLKDVQFALAPLDAIEAEKMLEETWAGQKLHGFRNIPAADRQAVIQALLRLAQLAADFPELVEIEINPLLVLAEGQGVMALDVRARVAR
jgi:acetyltransferase